jgi:23S rRNA pseudouridine2605 synthase
MLLRLQKVLAQAGLASRRQAEEWIVAGRVAVNGKVITSLGTQADPDVDRITVDGRPICRFEPKVYYVLNKPRGYVSTCEDERGRPTVLDLLKPLQYRLFPVGRLDWDTEGVLLLTNDGELAQRLLHPRYQMRRTYLAKVDGIPTPEALQRLVRLGRAPGGRGRPPYARLVKAGERHAWIEVRLWEGKNRQVRRMCDAIGHPVRRLRRMQFAGLDAEGLESGRFRPLTPAEVLALKRRAGLEQGRQRPG